MCVTAPYRLGSRLLGRGRCASVDCLNCQCVKGISSWETSFSSGWYQRRRFKSSLSTRFLGKCTGSHHCSRHLIAPGEGQVVSLSISGSCLDSYMRITRQAKVTMELCDVGHLKVREHLPKAIIFCCVWR